METGFPLSPPSPSPGPMFPTETSRAAWKLRSGAWGGAVCGRLGPSSTLKPLSSLPWELVSPEGLVAAWPWLSAPTAAPATCSMSTGLFCLNILHTHPILMMPRMSCWVFLHCEVKGAPSSPPPRPTRSSPSRAPQTQKISLAHYSFQLLVLSPFQKRLAGLNAEESGRRETTRCI